MPADKIIKQARCAAISTAFCALLIGLIGALSGFFLLASIPLQAFSSVADIQKFRDQSSRSKWVDASYLKGAMSRDRRWEQKREAFLSGGSASVDLSAAELNAWIHTKFPQPGPASAPEGRLKLFVRPGVPNSFIDATQGIYFNLPVQIKLYGITFDYLIVARGRFVESPQLAFQLDALRVNTAAVPLPGNFGNWLLDRYLKTYSESDEYHKLQQAWQTLESVEWVADRIRFNLRG